MILSLKLATSSANISAKCLLFVGLHKYVDHIHFFEYEIKSFINKENIKEN